MGKEQVLISILLVSLLLIFLLGFLFLVLLIQRRKNNGFITERENLKRLFNEQLMQSQIEIQEQSFNAISMEIHDSVGQTLSLLKMQLNILDEKASHADKLINEARLTATKAMADLRDIANSLSTDRIDNTELPNMVRHELRRITNTKLLKGSLKTRGQYKNLTNQRKLIVFRIIQECLQNVIKHSRATILSIGITYALSQLILEIKDNGEGFSPENLNPDTGNGLKNIQKRASVLGGSAQIKSTLKKGTKIIITIPYE